MEKSRSQRFVEFLLDNLFDIVTIFVAGYTVIRHQFRPFTSSDIGELATRILAVLGLIAVSGLWERNRRLRRIEKLSREGRDLISRHLSGKVRAGDFFLSEKRLSDRTFSSATEILLGGITQTRTTRQYMHVLGKRLQAGAHIRIMVIDSRIDSVMETMAARSIGETTPEYWRTRMETVSVVIEIIGSTPGSTGTLEIGYLPFIPSFGFAMIDPDEPHGTSFVELYHHRSAEPNPAFELRASDDPFWYRFFRNQYEVLWNSCRIEQASKHNGSGPAR